MNATCFALLLVAAMPWGASAAPPEPTTTTPLRVTASSQQPVTLTVNCEHGAWPTLQQIASEVGINVFDPPHHVRRRAVIEGLRACRRGATDVALVFPPAQDAQAQQPVRVAATP
jgi:hypothetical protein